MNTFVYIDFKPSREPFYVGIGNSQRVKDTRRNDMPRNICLKYPEWYRIVVETANRNLCEELECFLISEIGRRDLNTGTLSNLTDGGEGATNKVVSEHTRRKLSESLSGLEKTAEWKSRIGVANKGKVRSPEARLRCKETSTGRTHNAETKRKVSERSSLMWENIDLRKTHSGKIKAKWADTEYKERLRESHRIRQSDIEFKSNMSAKVSLAWQDQELRKSQSERMKRLIWVTDGVISKRVTLEHSLSLLILGWKRGRK